MRARRVRQIVRGTPASRSAATRSGAARSGRVVKLKHLSSVAQQPLHRALGLTDGEHERIQALLGRDPNDFELAVFSLLWSEHCGYKHSALLLKRLPSTGERVLQGPGENAGVLDLGDGIAVAFKVESHNHPSAVEPFQGAATGVGGILRDIVAMGARPVALLDGLRFGEPGHELSRAVGGIGAYGNSVGVPTVGGETVFDEAYRDNCLVNAMCVGLLPTARVMSAKATGTGQHVVLYGATTGRDGIGGASVLASQELDEGSAEKRPSVQIGDPFTGKKLIEASVELVTAGIVESLQDCGAAGLASSLSEMAAEFGIDVHLDRVPLREEGMEPWEVMISESQERMVALVRPQMLEAVEEVLDRWELHHAVIGDVTETGELRAFWQGELVGEVPARFLTDECPRYEVGRAPRAPKPAREIAGAPPTAEALLALLASPNLRSREFVYRRYDQLVGHRTVRRPGFDAAVLRLLPSLRGLAVSLDGQGPIARLDPFTGGALAVFEAARNVACAGGEPLGFTDCLNFGNPEKPEIGWELAEAIDGMAAACEALGLPIVSGNVSLYNETNGRAIHPTPVVGAVGLVEDVRLVPGGWHEGDSILVAEASPPSLAGSEYQARFGEVGGTPVRLDLAAEARLVRFLWNAAPRCTLVHDVSDGGLAVCLAEAAIHSGVGAELALDDDPLTLFGEVGGRAVLACAPEQRDEIMQLADELGVPVHGIGLAGGATLLGVELSQLRSAWEGN
jgi:phosphoribosylformylglycinamidine synthase subunit PurL